jgi:hypothetical protein
MEYWPTQILGQRKKPLKNKDNMEWSICGMLVCGYVICGMWYVDVDTLVWW